LIVIIDTNIFLNVVREEKEFVEASEQLLRKVQSKEITGLASCMALMEAKWALFEKKEYAKADRAVSLIEEIVEVVPVDKQVAEEAIDLKIRRRVELLDSIHVTTAMVRNAVFVTRDEDLRRKVDDIVVVKKPEDVLKELADNC
jgi:predicted nucleic acid-binding protein